MRGPGPGLMDPNGPGMMAGTLVSLTIVSTTRTESRSTEAETKKSRDTKFPKGNGMMYQVQLKGSRALFVHTKKSKNNFLFFQLAFIDIFHLHIVKDSSKRKQSVCTFLICIN